MINLEIIKVKGHLNIAENEEADKLAVVESNSNLRFTYRIDHSSQDFRCLACQNDNVEDWDYLLECWDYNEAWNAIHDKLTNDFKLIELLGRQANSAKFCEFVKLSMEVKCDHSWLDVLKKTLRIKDNEAIRLYVHFLFRFRNYMEAQM
ncbi:hypothetical protein RCL_jg3078.t1 [Rhizophagus clarus]|uniref:RNase H type-1 domain-containing protein n=1 Tax=Rhizophagus clarus TaxID=94130 RepID=A0A8H3R287_9GLOM|nr:hypothetical protein RCL_jg3078.t1 [Rhizophagus clarus]